MKNKVLASLGIGAALAVGLAAFALDSMVAAPAAGHRVVAKVPLSTTAARARVADKAAVSQPAPGRAAQRLSAKVLE